MSERLATSRRPFLRPSWLALLLSIFCIQQAGQFAASGWNYSELAKAAGSRRPYALAMNSYPVACGYVVLAIGLALEKGWARAVLRATLLWRLLFYFAPQGWQETAYGSASVWRLVIGSPAYVMMALAGAWLLRYRGEAPAWRRAYGADGAIPNLSYLSDWTRIMNVSMRSRRECQMHVTAGQMCAASRLPIPEAARSFNLCAQFVRTRGPKQFVPMRLRLAWIHPSAFELVPIASGTIGKGDACMIALAGNDLDPASDSASQVLADFRWPLQDAIVRLLEIRSSAHGCAGYVVEFEGCQWKPATETALPRDVESRLSQPSR